MANHVMTWIEVDSDNPDVYEKLNEMFPESDDWETKGQTMYLFDKLYGEGTEYDRSDYTEAIGAKWCYVEEADGMEGIIHTTSAWYYPSDAIEQLHHILSKIDEKVLVKFTYEDESYNPVGGGAVYMGELYAEEGDMEYPDEDNFDSEEEYDTAVDHFYDYVSDCKDEHQQNAIDYLMEEYKED
mgnify:CR=1 FL=1